MPSPPARNENREMRKERQNGHSDALWIIAILTLTPTLSVIRIGETVEAACDTAA
jgi:hypothetical protein